MQNVISWTKANPISVASIVAVLVAIGLLSWVHLDGRTFVQTMSQKQKLITDMDRYMSSRVQVPGLTPSDPPRTVGPLTINEPAIQQLEAVFNKMGGEYQQVFAEARKVNAPGHTPMLADLFPSPASSDTPYRAKDAYPLLLEAMLGDGSDQNAAANLPVLNAKPPLSMDVINAELQRIEQQYRSQNAIGPQGGFEPDQFDQLRRLKSGAVREMMLNHARTLNMYAQRRVGQDGFPFDVPAWVGEPAAPNEVSLWTGQMMLWIQQDIAQAIALANGVGEPGRDVTDSVVKRLISVDVVPGAVGLRHRGGLSMTQGGSGGYIAPLPNGAAATPPVTTSADKQLPDDFSISPTGRSSNVLYDVWHVWVEFVGDAQELPTFFNTLARVNFMTVLTVEITDVDEYEALREGYVYGPDDAVHVRMLVETIWLRDWTSKLMPPPIRQLLGVAQTPDQ